MNFLLTIFIPAAPLKQTWLSTFQKKIMFLRQLRIRYQNQYHIYRYLDRISIISLHPLENRPFECTSSTQTYQMHPMHGQKNTSTSYFWADGIVRPLLPYFCTRYPIFADNRSVHDLAVTSQSDSKVWFLSLRSCSSLQSITSCYGFLQVLMLPELLLPLSIRNYHHLQPMRS